MFKAHRLETALPEASTREHSAAVAPHRQGRQPACSADERWAPRWALLLSLTTSLLLWAVIAIMIL